ncbi:MAG TPA: glycosyltransferase [Anaerolineales bacterium]|nr:glycosyltransferase [Anaerolineales bacterium]
MNSAALSRIKRIAIVSDSLPYPRCTGDTMRVAEMIEVLRKAGWEVHFIAPTLNDERDGQDCLKYVDYFHAYITPINLGLLRRLILILLRFLYRIKVLVAKLIRRRFVILPAKDWWGRYPQGLDDFVRTLHNQFSFEVVMVEYIWQYPACGKLPDNVLKILDTHDLQYLRVQEFASRGLRFPLPITQKQEARIFALFNAIIAIQSQEADLIRSMVPGGKVLVVGTSAQPQTSIESDPVPERILYVGGDNPANADGLRRFLEHCWPVIADRYPGASLHVVGNVSRNFPGQKFERVEFLGHVPDVAMEYKQAEVAINPIWIGTGLKIKTVEALAHGKPLVTTGKGVEGMHPAAVKACTIAHSEAEFAEAVMQLLASEDLRRANSERARAFADDMLSLEAVYGDLLAFLDQHARNSSGLVSSASHSAV